MQVQGTTPPRDQDYFLSLGAGSHQIPLIEAARRKGYSVIAVDRNPLAPGFKNADLQLHCSVLKPFWIYRAIEEHFPRGTIRAVGSRSFGPAVLSASYLARRFKVPGSDPRSIIQFQDKNRLKAKLASQGIPVPERIPWTPGMNPDAILRKRGTWIARSGKGSAKQGIEVLTSVDEKRQYVENHRKRTPHNRSLFIEKYYNGSEYIIYGIVLNGVFHCLALTEKVVSEEAPRFADRRHIFPARISEEMATYMQSTAQKIVSLCKYDNGPFFAEFLIPKKGKKPLLIECQPEVGGEFLADSLVPGITGLSYFDMLIDLTTQGPTAAAQHLQNVGISLKPGAMDHILRPSKSAVLSYILPSAMTIQDVRMPVSLREDPSYVFLEPLKPIGYAMDPARGNADRPAAFMLMDSVSHRDELIRKAEHFEKQIKIIPALPPARRKRRSGKKRKSTNPSRRSIALSVSIWKPLI
ncbi:MAG: ATP-grasp domain-containing protein [Leptospiraceae bacterium]|nr:ATP-grasp domain-containing protein [Leptospiraceae bacterium]